MPIYGANKKAKIYLGNQKVKKAYLGSQLVYSAGNTVIYQVDSGNSYSEEVDDGSSCLSPKTFTPQKSGWIFAGWRLDTTASGTVLTTKTMDGAALTLYAVFKQTITVTYYNNSASASNTTEIRYYNNGNVTNPSFTLTQAAKSGWSARGWSTGTAGNSGITYNNGAAFTRDSNITLYGMYQQTITVTYYNNSTSASSTSGTRYYNSNGNVVNPSFALTQANSSGWTCRGWSASNSGNAGITYANGATFTRDSNITLYGLYQHTVTVTYYNNSTTASTTTGTRYWAPAGYINPSFTLTQTSRSGWSARGWSTSTAGNGGISYNNATAFTRDSNITLYGMYQQTITVTYYNNSTSASSTSGTRYYNSNGNVTNPSFTLTQAARSGWSARGWSTGTAGNGGISYNNGTAFTRDSNVTLYGMYYQTITLTYYNASTTAASTSGTRYYNSGNGNITNPTFTLTPATMSGWSFRGWATSSSASASISYSSISGTAFSANATVYAAYSQTITLSYNGNGSTSGSTSAQTGTRYWNTGNTSNPSFTLRANGFSRSGYTFTKWALNGTGGTQYAPGASITLSSSATMYALWIASTVNATGNSNYVTTTGMLSGYDYWSCGVWYSKGEATTNGTININYNGYKKVSIVFTFEYNGTSGEMGTVCIGGSTVVNCKKGTEPSSYTYSGSATSIAIAMNVRNDYIQYSWSDIKVRISSVTLSM